jgi:hypothetical protein
MSCVPINETCDVAIKWFKDNNIFFAIGIDTQGTPYVRVTLPVSHTVIVSTSDLLSEALSSAVKATKIDLKSISN